MSRRTSLLFIITLAYFALGFVNILFAYLAIACMTLPFILLQRDKKKTWCQKACPRAELLTRLSFVSRKRSTPLNLTGPKAKRIVLTYFCINMGFIIMSTFAVSQGQIEAIERVRFLMAMEIPWALPQIFTIQGVSKEVLHLAYRLYSIMFSSTVVGIIFAILYKPRTWCVVCPINTLSDSILERAENNAS